MKNQFTIFFAIPFDSLTRDTYEKLTLKLREHYKKKNYLLTTIVGDGRIGTPQKYWDVVSFKAQNQDLNEQFVQDIKSSHVVVADLTNGNPNVHLELGVALANNKNILRVTGRKVDEIGFDIRNLATVEYADSDNLFSIVTKYLDCFFSIKRLGFDSSLGPLYKKINPIPLPGTPGEVDNARGSIWHTIPPIAIFRDGGIKLKLKLGYSLSERSWAAVIFRMSEVDKTAFALRFYKNGTVELARQPDGVIEKKTVPPQETLEIIINIQNDEVEAKVNNTELSFDAHLDLQTIGSVRLATFEMQAHFENIEMINRDTI